MASMKTGLFIDRDIAEHTYRSASERGYGKDDVNMMMSQDARKKHFPGDGYGSTKLGTKAAAGAGVGGAIGPRSGP